MKNGLDTTFTRSKVSRRTGIPLSPGGNFVPVRASSIVNVRPRKRFFFPSALTSSSGWLYVDHASQVCTSSARMEFHGAWWNLLSAR